MLFCSMIRRRGIYHLSLVMKALILPFSESWSFIWQISPESFFPMPPPTPSPPPQASRRRRRRSIFLYRILRVLGCPCPPMLVILTIKRRFKSPREGRVYTIRYGQRWETTSRWPLETTSQAEIGRTRRLGEKSNMFIMRVVFSSNEFDPNFCCGPRAPFGHP